MREMKRRTHLRDDPEGGIEGLPLQLLIMVVVAGLGLTIVMGWMSSISTPKAIGEVFVTPGEILVYDDDSDGLYTRYGLTISVIVTDQGGERLQGATVMLDGANVMTSSGDPVRGVTNENGQVVFADVCVEKFGSGITTVTVTVAKGDYGVDSSYEIPVVPD